MLSADVEKLITEYGYIGRPQLCTSTRKVWSQGFFKIVISHALPREVLVQTIDYNTIMKTKKGIFCIASDMWGPRQVCGALQACWDTTHELRLCAVILLFYDLKLTTSSTPHTLDVEDYVAYLNCHFFNKRIIR